MTQKADDHSIAVQSGRDTIIHSGISTQQMSTIMNELSNLLPAFVSIARVAVDERMDQFRDDILKKFATPAADPNAFKDPDFQYVLNQAQNAYARSGDPDLAATLVDMIAERSLQKDRSRLTLTLNAAIDTAAELTPEEFAELS